MVEVWDNLLLIFFAICVVVYGASQIHFDQDMFHSEIVFTQPNNVLPNFYFGFFVLIINIPNSWSLFKNNGDHWLFSCYLVIALFVQMVYFAIKILIRYRYFYLMTNKISKITEGKFVLLNVIKIKTSDKLSPISITYELDGIKQYGLMEVSEPMSYKAYPQAIEKYLLKELDPLGNKAFDFFVRQAPKENT